MRKSKSHTSPNYLLHTLSLIAACALVSCSPDATLNPGGNLDNCEANTHIWWNDTDIVCEPDSVTHCGSHENDCLALDNTLSAECVQGKNGAECKITECKPGFVLHDGECLTGNRCCGPNCKDCTQNGSSNDVCYTLDNENYECGSGCPDNAMILCNGVCVDPNTSLVYCGSESRDDGSCEIRYCPDLVDGWSKGACASGKCQLWECQSGYHVDEESNTCKPDKPESCGSDEIDCTQIAHQTNVACNNGQCELLSCEPDYSVQTNTCVLTNPETCGNANVICGDHQHCNTETELCECDPGFTDCDGTCYDLKSDPTHCNRCDNICNIANADNQCANAQCIFTCKEGFIQVDNACEPRICKENDNRCVESTVEVCQNNTWETLNACPSNNSCANDTTCGECINGARRCADNQHYQVCASGKWSDHILCPGTTGSVATCTGDGVCSDDCDTGLSSNGAICCPNVANAQILQTNNEKCEFECYNGYCKNGSSCTSNQTDVNNCGSCGNICAAPSNGVVLCTSGVCGFMCNTGYCKSDAGCVSPTNDVNNCGTCGNKCTTTISNATPVCSNSKCSWKCGTGYCVYQSTCQDQRTSAVACGSSCTDCTRAFSNGKNFSCDAGVCRVTECAKGYVVSNNQCVPATSCTNNPSGYVHYPLPDGNEVLAYCIRSASELETLRTNSRTGKPYPDSGNTANAYVIADNTKITLTNWTTGIGQALQYYPFKGVFGGMPGSSLIIQDATTGLFSATEGAVISNLNMNISMNITSGNIGGLVNSAAKSTFDNITITTSIKYSGSNTTDNVGGMIGADTESTIANCYVESPNITVNGSYVGGVVGSAENTAFKYTKASIEMLKSGGITGGFVGNMNGGTAGNCVAIANIEAGGFAGGFVGQAENSAYFDVCAAFGDKVSAYDSAGGFVGSSTSAAYQSCLNANSISGQTKIGGFAGGTGSPTVGNCYAFASISCGGSNCYYFAPSVGYFSPSVSGSAYYYANGCERGNCTAASNTTPIELNGTTMTRPSLGAGLTCKVPFGKGQYTLSLPSSIEEMVIGDICH